jgi:uncharacterized protein involved in exopolysaccharide biosynthesis
MSTRPAHNNLDLRLFARREEPAATDLQQVVARVLSVLRRRRWLFIIPMLTGVTGALVISLFLPRQYRLSALFERRDDVVITKLVTDNSPYSFTTLRQSLNINLAGYNAVSEAADQLGLTRDFPRDASGELTPEGRARKQALVVALGRQIEVGLLEKSSFLDLIEVRYKGDDPDLGIRLVTRLKDNYITNTRAWISDIVVKARDFFQQEVSRRSGKVARIEAELLEESLRHPGVDPTDPDVLRDRLLKEATTLEELGRKRAETRSNIAAREACLAQLNESKDHLPATRPAELKPAAPVGQPRNPQWQQIHGQIEQVRLQITDARTLRKMTDQHPHVVALNAKLSRLEAELALVPETLAAGGASDAGAADPLVAERRRLNMELKPLGETLAQAERDMAVHQAEKVRLEQEKDGLFERRQHFVMRQQELNALKSDLSAWNGHLEAISRVLAAEAEDRGIRFATVEEARRPGKPASPTMVGVLLISLGLGVALGVGAVFVREVFDRSFRSAARVRESLGIPVLEVIGDIRVGPPPRWFSRRRLLPALASLASVAAIALCALVYLSVEQPAVYQQLAGRVARVVNKG